LILIAKEAKIKAKQCRNSIHWRTAGGENIISVKNMLF
jgi:hypothetical protein